MQAEAIEKLINPYINSFFLEKTAAVQVPLTGLVQIMEAYHKEILQTVGVLPVEYVSAALLQNGFTIALLDGLKCVNVSFVNLVNMYAATNTIMEPGPGMLYQQSPEFANLVRVAKYSLIHGSPFAGFNPSINKDGNTVLLITYQGKQYTIGFEGLPDMPNLLQVMLTLIAPGEYDTKEVEKIIKNIAFVYLREIE